MGTDIKAFYKTQEWRDARQAYLKRVGGLCERCLKRGLITPAIVVHHRIHLDSKTITDPKMRTGYDNLEALCWACHEREHKSSKRYMVDINGHVYTKPEI